MELIRSNARRRLFILRHLLPITVIVGTSFGCLFALLFHLTAIQDRMEAHRQHQHISSGFDDAARLAAHDLRDYAKWDDAVRYVAHRLDPDWVDGSISTYLTGVQRYEHVFVVGPDNRTIYEFGSGARRPVARDARAILGDGFAAGLRQLRTLRFHEAPAVGGYSRRGSKIYVFAAASVVPLTSRVSIDPGPTNVIVIAAEVDRTFLIRMADGHNIPPLRLERSLFRKAEASLMLVTPSRQPIARMAWKPDRPGTLLRRRILPAFIAVGLAALVAAGLILRRAWRDVGALQSSQSRLQHLANHDMLTGLPNRHAIMERLREGIANGGVSLLYMDLDGFKDANDLYGHPVGDELLVRVAARIGEVVAGAGIVGRVGGDEFAVVMPGHGPAELRQCAEAILDAIRCPVIIGGYSINVGVSIGIADGNGVESSEEIIRQADVAMYTAKAAGKNDWCAYEPMMDRRYELRRWLEHDLRRAIENDDIGVAFQTIVDAGTQRIAGVEALVRWTHPEHGPVAPDLFIPIAEETGLITELGQKVLIAACREALAWNVMLSVNLSPAQFWDRELASRVRTALALTGFPAERLALEITENYFLRRPEAARKILEELRQLGIRIVLDDFGSGFASIGYLRQLTFDGVKIDRSFVEKVASNHTAADLARALVAVGRALDLEVTAEGIETEEQAIIMRLAGCRRLQGWHFSRPAPAAQVARLLASNAASFAIGCSAEVEDEQAVG